MSRSSGLLRIVIKEPWNLSFVLNLTGPAYRTQHPMASWKLTDGALSDC